MTEVYTQRQAQLGKEHPRTLWALSYLCKIHIHHGQLTTTEALLTWDLAAATRSLGRDYLGMLMGRGQLAVIYAHEPAAIVLLRRVAWAFAAPPSASPPTTPSPSSCGVCATACVIRMVLLRRCWR